MNASTNLTLLSLSLLIGACQKPDEPANDRPSIKAVSFVGVPAQNVNFDASNSRITVQMPAYLEQGLQPVFTLTDGARVIDGVTTNNLIDLSPFCGCNMSTTQPRKTIIRIGNQKTTAVYELIAVTTGPMKAHYTTEQFTFSRQTKRLELSLPVENLYNNPFVNRLKFTNLATGGVTGISADAACLNGCSNTIPNRMIFSLGSPINHELVPGTYSISLNGIDFPQRLLVVD